MLLLIDNYDSFTYNLMHFLGELGEDVVVHRNDAMDADEALAMEPEMVIVSPGPCTPTEAGISLDLIKKSAERDVPVMGVCLGHQAIGQAFGGTIVRKPPMHGKISHVYHSGQGVMVDIPSPFKATRYHSLVVERKSIPESLDVTAETEDGLIMGVRHKDLPIHGVQFHPESIASEYGHKLLKNFLNIARDGRQ